MSTIVTILRCARAVLLAGVAGIAMAPAVGAGCLCGTLADEFHAADAGLVREWIVQVPFDSAAWRLERVVVVDGFVLVQSGDGGMYAVSTSGSAGLRAGTVAWSRPGAGWGTHHGLDGEILADEGFSQAGPASPASRDAPALAGPPVVSGSSAFVVTTEGTVARIATGTASGAGQQGNWTALLPDRATSGAFVSGEVVIVAAGPMGIVGLSALDGRELWRNDLAGTPVATGGGRVWLLDEIGRLTALDAATGRRLRSFCLGPFTLPVVNTLTDRLILASPQGLVVSLAPPATPASGPAKPEPVSGDGPPTAESAPGDPGPTPP